MELTAMIEAEFAKHTLEELVERLTRADIAHERIAHAGDVLRDPQARANNYIVETTEKNGEKVLTALTPVKIDTLETHFRYGIPSLGEHTAQVLQELGYTEEEIAALEREQVVTTGG